MSSDPQFDPFAPWKQFQGPMMDAWAKAMSEAAASQDFTQAMAQSLNAYFEAAAPFQKQIEQALEKYIQQMQLPSRSEVLQLSERLTSIEMRLDDIEAKIDDLLDRSSLP